MNILIPSANPEDALFCLGGTIAKNHEQGNNIYIMSFFDGISSKYSEYERALECLDIDLYHNKVKESYRYLGAKEVHMLKLRDNCPEEYTLFEITRKISEFVDKISPEVIISNNDDTYSLSNKKISDAAKLVCKPHRLRIPCSLYTFSVPDYKSSDDNHVGESYVDITNFISIKIKAIKRCEFLKTYYLRENHPYKIKCIVARNMLDGIDIGVKYAEKLFPIKTVAFQ